MRTRAIFVLSLVGLLLPPAPGAPAAAGAEVKGYETFEEIREHNQLPLDPYPPFGLMTGYICYPNPFYGSKQFQVTPRKLRLLVAENEYLKIALCPDYGGRLYYLYDKVRKREAIHRIVTDAKFYNAGMGYQYVGGGLELNLPNAHSQTNARPRECVLRKNADGSVSLVMSNTEKIGRIHWTVSFTLRPGEARVRQDVRIANETAVEARYLYWANCGIPLKDNTEYIFPETKGAMHGKYESVYSWPVYEGANISLIKNLEEMLGLYMLEAREGFFGYFSHDDKAGLVHCADVNDVPGKKYWSWGWHEAARHTRLTHTDGQPYGEVQAGRIVIQEKFDRLLPLTSQTWTEVWYPIGDIGAFNGASENAAVNFAVWAKGSGAAIAEIRVQASRVLRDVSLSIEKGGKSLGIVKEPLLSPDRPLARTVEFTCDENVLDQVSLVLRDSAGRTIAEVRSRAMKPAPFDAYFAPEKRRTSKAEDHGAEGIFAKAESLAADWFYHLPRQKQLLEDCLRIDPGFSRAHAELGLLDYQAGRFAEALARFDKALERIPDDGRTLYYKGLALRHLGRFEDAHYFLRHAARFGYEAQERAVEAEMAIVRGDLEEADGHLERAIVLSGGNLKGYALRAIVLNRQKRTAEARKMLETARGLDPENALVSAVRYVLENSPELGNGIRKRYRNFSEELLEVVVLLYAAGLYPESRRVLGLIENDNDIIGLYRAELESKLGLESATGRRGTVISQDFAWRLEEYLALENQIKRRPGDGGLHYHLGNFLYAHDREDEGIGFWKKALELGYRDKISLYSLFRAEKKRGRAGADPLAHLEDARKLDPGDPYLFDDYVSEVKAKDGPAAAIKLLEDNIGRFMNCFTTCGTLLHAYLLAGDYDKLEEFASKMTLGQYWRTSLGRDWMIMKMARGYRNLSQKRYREALADFEASIRVPANLEARFLADQALQARRLFYIGFCHSKLDDAAAAGKAWTEALNLNLHIRFETSALYAQMNVRYWQAFCLKGLGRQQEADLILRSIREFAGNEALAETTPETRKHLLTLAFLGRETSLDLFERFDTELGITTFAAMATSVED